MDKKLTKILLQFLEQFLDCIPHNIHEECFQILDILLEFCWPYITSETLIRKYISQFVDQFTMKSKAQQNSLNNLLKISLNQGSHPSSPTPIFFNTVFTFCLLENEEPNLHKQKQQENFDSKEFQKGYDQFIEKLNISTELLKQLPDYTKTGLHMPFLLSKLKDKSLQKRFNKLLRSGNSKIRLKALTLLDHILKGFVGYFDEKGEGRFTSEMFKFSQFLVQTVEVSLREFEDPKLQFNSMLILDGFFRKIMVGPTIQQEFIQHQQQLEEQLDSDFEIIEIDSFMTRISSKFTFDSLEYLHLRLSAILKVWPFVKILVFSTWSNIRNIVYAILCNWLMPDINLYDVAMAKPFKKDLKKTLMSLLTSAESESRTGGLNILGSICGMSQNFEALEEKVVQKNLGFFRRNSQQISLAIWETVYLLQEDWDQTNQTAATVLIQLAAPKQFVLSFTRLKQESISLKYNNSQRNSHHSPLKLELKHLMGKQKQQRSFSQDSSEMEEESVFWLELLTIKEVVELVGMFKNEYQAPQTLWIERVDYNLDNLEKIVSNKDLEFINVYNDEEFPEQQADDIQYGFGMNQQQNGQGNQDPKRFNEDDDIDYDELGIIDVDEDDDIQYPTNIYDTTKPKTKVKKELLSNLLDIPEIPAFNPKTKKQVNQPKPKKSRPISSYGRHSPPLSKQKITKKYEKPIVMGKVQCNQKQEEREKPVKSDLKCKENILSLEKVELEVQSLEVEQFSPVKREGVKQKSPIHQIVQIPLQVDEEPDEAIFSEEFLNEPIPQLVPKRVEEDKKYFDQYKLASQQQELIEKHEEYVDRKMFDENEEPQMEIQQQIDMQDDEEFRKLISVASKDDLEALREGFQQMTISGLKNLNVIKPPEEVQQRRSNERSNDRKESSDDSYPDPINYEEEGRQEEGSQEFMDFLNQYGQKDENGEYRLDNNALALMQIAQTKKKEQQKYAQKQKNLQDFLSDIEGKKSDKKVRTKKKKAQKPRKQSQKLTNQSVMKKILKGARSLIKKEKEVLNKTLETIDKKRRSHLSGQFEKKVKANPIGLKKKLKQPIIDDLLLQLKTKTNTAEKRSSSANKYASRLGNLIKTQTIANRKKKLKRSDRQMQKNTSLKLLSKSALRHQEFKSPSRGSRKKKPFLKKKRPTLKKNNFLSFSFKKQHRNEKFLGRKQINVLKQ